MRKPVKLAIASCMAVVLAACGGTQDIAEVKKDTLVVAQGSDAKTLDPHATNDQPSSRVSAQIYSQLVETDADMNIIPALATSWEFESDTSTVFNLRQGVKFHNGEELKASDVKFTLDRMIASPTVAHIVGAIDSIDVIDDYTVRVNTKEPFGPLLYHFTHTATSILNEKAVTEGGNDYGQNPVGTGPYQFVDWVVGDRVTMKAFEDYYEGEQEITNAIFRNVTEGTNRAIALETGEVDIAYDIEPIDMSTITGNDKLTLVEEESLATDFFGFNTQRPPFDNVKVRQAIGYAVNSNDIIEAVLLGSGRAANSPIGPTVFGYSESAFKYEQDIDKARELMAEAGYEDGFKTTISTNDNPIRIQIAQILQAQLRKVNVDMAIEVTEWGAFLDASSRGEQEMFILGWVSVTGDADYGLFPQFSSTTHGSAGNRTFYSNAEVDDLLLKARTSTDQQERIDLYAEVQGIIQEELPFFSMYNKFQNVGMQKNVTGFEMSPGGHHRIKGVRFEG